MTYTHLLYNYILTRISLYLHLCIYVYSRDEAKRRIEDEKYAECSFQPKLYTTPSCTRYNYDLSSDNNNIYNPCPVDIYTTHSTPPPTHSNTHANHTIIHTSSPKSYINLSEPKHITNNWRAILASKQAYREAQLIAKEIREMRECTFKPNIPSYPPPLHASSTASFSTSPGGGVDDGQVRQEPIIIRGTIYNAIYIYYMHHYTHI